MSILFCLFLFSIGSPVLGDRCSTTQGSIIRRLNADISTCEARLDALQKESLEASARLNLEELTIQAGNTINTFANIMVLTVSNYTEDFIQRVSSFDYPNSHFLIQLLFPFTEKPTILVTNVTSNVVPLNGIQCELENGLLASAEFGTNKMLCENGKYFTYENFVRIRHSKHKAIAEINYITIDDFPKLGHNIQTGQYMAKNISILTQAVAGASILLA